MPGHHRRARSATGEALEEIMMEENMILGRSNLRLGTLRSIFDKKRSRGAGEEIYYAARHGQDKLLQKLLEGEMAAEDLLFQKLDQLNTALHKAAQYGHSICAFQLIFAGCPVNLTNRIGETPLHLAVKFNHVDMAKFLIQHGADPNLCESVNGLSPVHAMSRNGSYRCLMAVLEVQEEAAVRQRKDGKFTVIPIDPETRTKEGQTALHLCSVDRGAFRKNNSNIVTQLIRIGADVNALDRKGATPLHVAAFYGAWEICTILTASGASKTLKDFEGRAPVDVVMNGLSLHLNIDGIERKILQSKITSLLRTGAPGDRIPGPFRQNVIMRQSGMSSEILSSNSRPQSYKPIVGPQSTPVPVPAANGLEVTNSPSSPILLRERKHRRNSSDPTLSMMEQKRKDKEMVAQFLQDQKANVANQTTLRVLFHHENSPRRFVFLAFDRSWTVLEAKQYVCAHLRLPKGSDEGYALLLPHEEGEPNHKIMADDELLTSYQLESKDPIIFQELDAPMKPITIDIGKKPKFRSLRNLFAGNGPSPPEPNARFATQRKKKLAGSTPHSGSTNATGSVRLHTNPTLSPIERSNSRAAGLSRSRAPVKMKMAHSDSSSQLRGSLGLHKAALLPEDDDGFRAIVETPPFHLPRGVIPSGDEEKEDIFELEEEQSHRYSQAPLSEDDVEEEHQRQQERIQEAVQQATLPLHNELARLNNRLHAVHTNQAPVVLPFNHEGIHPGDQGIWCPSTLFELDSMRPTTEPVQTEAPHRKMQKLRLTTRVDQLLEHYRVLLPPGFLLSEKIRIFRDFVLYGEHTLDAVLSQVAHQ